MKKILFLFILFIACNKQSDNNPKVITILTIFRHYGDNLSNQGRYNISKEIKVDSLNILKISKHDTITYIYKIANKIFIPDTLKVIDSHYILNRKSLKIFQLKDFSYKKKKVRIFKCNYSQVKGEHPIFYNIFLNDSLGIIMKRVVSQRSSVYEYGPDFDELQKEIKKDSIFFAFQ